MLTNEQLEQLKKQLKNEQKSLEANLDKNKAGSLESVNARETVGELSIYDNHPADMGTELYEREKDFALEEHHDSELNKVNAALLAIDNGSYGKCKVCGNDILFDRLEVLPSTLYCKEHSPEQHIPGDRPVEEDVLEPAHGNTFQHHQFREVIDNEDSFQEVARYGTSETPSDLRGDYEDYNSLYNEGHDDEGFTEDYETFIGSNLEGTNRKVYPSKKHEEYEAMLDKAGTETSFGDVPYHRTDGYVDDHD
ncbi:TraR/DksA C4-type zinc finger protein [Bacillus sp. FJAT-29790]|uniref:TraR/DksA C4-type zinc finger protein n=1 Tax=Bacillus sp. FJAT-29790 TaxID=1895002 RepID=UPI001C23012A|nr:TraR/DksA C4-type zinc finger protein [Bacillus sp. FJAT-29790]MBU8879866.1 TraR/DksA C4-type zinc finger protein [Bacillus sp. FJAT-29790]